MREFDGSCLTPIKSFAARDIARLRRREDASQAVFAHHLGVSVNLISQWERGEKKGLDWVA
jgi:putative transcriptional regulator